MPLIFDATLKDIVRTHLPDYDEQLHLPDPPATTVLNVDLSTISAATDIAIGHGDLPVCISDVNFQASRDVGLPGSLLLYHAVLYHRFGVPVHSVVVLLRPAADDAGLTGKLHYQTQPRRGKMAFRYEVVRLWRIPARKLLEGGIGTLPLAVLGQVPAKIALPDALRQVVRGIDERLAHEAPAEAARLMNAAFILSGLRIPREEARTLFHGVVRMRESSTYQMILDEGQVKGATRLLVRHARKKLGEPDAATRAALESIGEVERLERMFDQIALVSKWAELLQTP